MLLINVSALISNEGASRLGKTSPADEVTDDSKAWNDLEQKSEFPQNSYPLSSQFPGIEIRN